MDKENGHWEMTLTPVKVPKGKIKKWFFWNMYWKIWFLGGLKFKAQFFKILVKLLVPKKYREYDL